MWYAFVISLTKQVNWDGTDFKVRVGTRCLEYSEWALTDYCTADRYKICANVVKALKLVQMKLITYRVSQKRFDVSKLNIS